MMKRIEKWHWLAVRNSCVKNDFYTRGSNEEYEAMLGMVMYNKYSDDKLREVAEDILEHSEGQTLENIMYCIYADAVNVFFEVA